MILQILFALIFKGEPLAASYQSLDSARIERLRECAINGDLDSAVILATHWAPIGKSRWLSEKERSFWLAVCAYNGMPILLNQESLLGPGNRSLRLGLLRNAKCPEYGKKEFLMAIKYRYKKLEITDDAICIERDSLKMK